MKAIDFPARTDLLGAPVDWDYTKADCVPLPVAIEADYVISVWRPSLWEKLKLLFGYDVALFVWGGQPPVAIEVYDTGSYEFPIPDAG